MGPDRSWRIPATLDAGSPPVEVHFSAEFCSGNCAAVRYAGPWAFEILPAPDCAGAPYETHNRTWFYFCVSNVPRNQKIQLTIRNLNNQRALFEHGMKPVFRAVPSHPGWDRVPGAVQFESHDKTSSSITFSHKFLGGTTDKVYFAFCYPYSFRDWQRRLESLSARFRAPGAKGEKHEAGPEVDFNFSSVTPSIESIDADNQERYEAREHEAHMTQQPVAAGPGAGTKAAASRCQDAQLDCSDDGIYFFRECLARSLQGRPIDVLTITSSTGAFTAAKSACERDASRALLSRYPFMFPDKTPSPLRFPGRPIVFVSARVHPGETPASFSFDGFLDFLLDNRDPRAKRLRETFVFKLVPMLNPDGVAIGHYRCNTLGLNLNRFYHAPDPKQHPSIAAVRALLTFYANYASWTSLFMYLDMHAHASKRGCFLFGNYFCDLAAQVENMTFSRLVALNCPYLDLNECSFSAKNMAAKDRRDSSVSKEGSGRVALFRATGVQRCYTLECNYNCGKVLNDIPPARGAKQLGGKQRSEAPPNRPDLNFVLPQSFKYDPSTWSEVGKACAVALLDLVQGNSFSRLDRSPYRSLQGLKLFIHRSIQQSRQKSQTKKRGKARPRGNLPVLAG